MAGLFVFMLLFSRNGKTVAFQRFYELVDTPHLTRDVNALRTMRGTLSTLDAMTGLSQSGNAAVIPYKEGTSLPAELLLVFCVLLLFLDVGQVPFFDTFIIM